MIGKKHQAILRALAELKPPPFKPSDVLLSKLVQLGLVHIERDPNSFKIRKVWLSEAGWAWIKLERESR